MAITPSQKNSLAILRTMRDNITQRTNINNFDEDSKTRSIADSLTREVLDLRQQSIAAFSANNIATSKGKDLVELGESWGVPLNNNTFAQVFDTEQSLAFYVESGTFGDINSGGDITIPAGELVYSAPNNNELGTTVNYRLTTSVTLPAASALAYVSAKAETSGSGSNVGQGVLRNHEFTNYTDSGANTLKVINFYPILNGRNREQDERYRFRIAQNYNRLHQNSDARILLTALKVPGVLEVKPISGFFGIGTVGVVVLGAENESNPSLIEQVQARLNRYKGPAGSMTAIPATQVLIDLELDVKTVRKTSNAEQARLRTQIQRSIANYLRSVGLAGVVRFDELAKSIQLDTNQMVKLSTTGSVKQLFKSIYLRRGFAYGAFSEKETFISTNLLLAQDEFANIGLLTVNFI